MAEHAGSRRGSDRAGRTVSRRSGWWVGLLALATVGLAAVGLRAVCGPPPSWPDAIYDGLQLFALTGTDCKMADGAGGLRTPYPLLIAELLAVFLVFLAVLRLFFAPIWLALRLRLQIWVSGRRRYILIGFGAINQEIARDLALRRIPMTIVSRDFDGAMRDFAWASRAILLERDIRRDGAMAGLGLNRCSRVVVACGEDSLTYHIARQIGRLRAESGASPPARDVVYAHFGSVELHRQLMQSRDIGLGSERQFSGFAIREEAARYLVARAWLVERAHDRGHSRVHAVVVGAGDMGIAVTREILQNGCSAMLDQPPLISVIDRDGAAARARFHAAMPRLFDETIPAADRPVFQFFTATVEAIDPLDSRDRYSTDPLHGVPARFLPIDEDDAPSTDPVTTWVLCCPDDTQNLTAAMQLEAAMFRGIIPPASIHPRQWQANVSDRSRFALGQSDPLHLVAPFGGMDDVIETLPFIDATLIDLGREVHAEYLLTLAAMEKGASHRQIIEDHGLPPWDTGKGPEDVGLRRRVEEAVAVERGRFRETWDLLDDEGRGSNLEPAKQVALRLWELGYDWKGRYMGVLPNADGIDPDQKVPRSFEAAEGKDDLLAAIAEAEHRRWMVERALRGWSAARVGARSNAMRLHPNFRSIEDLRAGKDSGDVRDLDLSTVRGLIRGLALRQSPVLPVEASDPVEVDIDGLKAPVGNVSHLALRLPDRAFDNAALKESLEYITRWMKGPTALSIRLLVENAETLAPDNTALRDAVGVIHNAQKHLLGADGPGVHVALEIPDARAERRAVAHP